MTKTELQNIFNIGENQTVEFKTSFDKEAIETITAFANTNGGAVYIGVNEKSNKIIGVSISKESVQNWINEIKTKTEPSIIPDVKIIEIEGKIIVKISVKEYPVKPVSVRGRYFVRKQNSNHQLSIQEIADIYMQSMQYSWDSYEYKNANYNDLDENIIYSFIEKINKEGRFKLPNDAKLALKKINLLKNETVTNAAMILFAKEDLKYNVHIGRFKTKSLIIADTMVSGNLYNVLEKSMQTIISHLKFAFEITGKTTQRSEIPEYPLGAIRELLINALVHRDYTNPSDIKIKIFDNEITFFNAGKLFGGLTVSDLETDDYQAQSRNKLITEALYLTKDIEKYGSGYSRIRNYISEYPTMKFKFKEISGGFLTKLLYSKQKITTKDVTKDVTKDERLNLIIKIINKNVNITVDEIANKLNVTRRTILRDMENLQKQNKIKRIGGRKTGYWEVVK